MTPEQNLIQQITRVIENNQLDKNLLLEELAAQYSELCGEVNTRLLRCAEYLQKSLLSEAVYEARMAPDLLELAELVQFELSRKWRVICDDLELNKAPLLHVEILDQLRSACGKEKELQPLLREFRRLIYQGLQQQAIDVLRKIRAADPDNNSWKSNLQTYEEAELPQWLEKGQMALESMDLPALREIYTELTHPQRVVPAPSDFLDRLRRSLLSEKAAEMLLESENILNRLSEGLARTEVDKVRQLLQQASQMESEDAFYRRPDNWDEQINLARAWLDKEEREMRLQAEFEEEGKQLRALLRDDTYSEESLSHALEHLRSWSRPIAPELEKNAEESLLSLKTKRLRRAQQRKTFIFASGCIILLLAALLSHRISRNNRLKSIINELENDYRNSQFSEMQYKLENLQRYQSSFYQTASVQNYARRLEAALGERGERDRLAERFFSELDDIRLSGYRLGDDAIMLCLAKADQLLLSDREKEAVAVWKNSWQSWKTVQRRESNGVLQLLCNQFRAARSSMPGTSDSDFEVEEEKLRELQVLFQGGLPHFSRAEDLFKEDFQQCQAQLADWQRDLQQRRQQKAGADLLIRQKAEQLASLSKEIFQVLPDLRQYRRQLEQLRVFHDGKMPLEYSAALDNLEEQNKALLLQNFSMRSFPCSAQQEGEIRELLNENGDAQGSVWESDLRRCLSYLDKHQQVLRKIRTLPLEQEHMFQVYVIEIRKKDSDAWEKFYVPALPSSREERDNKGVTHTLYWGNVFYAEADDEEPHEMHTSKVFPGGLSSLQYDVKIGRRTQDCLSSQGKFLLAFILNAQTENELDIAILAALQSLSAPSLQMELIPRVWLQKRLLNILAEHYAEEIPESLAWAEAVNHINTNVPWMNGKHPAVLAASESVKKAGAFHPDVAPIMQRLKINRELLARTLSRRVHCVGVIRFDENGLPVPSLLVPPGGELWLLSTLSAHSPAYWRILSHDGENMLPEVLRNAYLGQLIFAPQASTFTNLQLPLDRAGIQKPHSWPVNDSQLGL